MLRQGRNKGRVLRQGRNKNHLLSVKICLGVKKKVLWVFLSEMSSVFGKCKKNTTLKREIVQNIYCSCKKVGIVT